MMTDSAQFNVPVGITQLLGVSSQLEALATISVVILAVDPEALHVFNLHISERVV